MSAVEPIFPHLPTLTVAPVLEATQVIETVGVEVLETTPDAALAELTPPDHANDVIPFASTLRRVG